MKLLVVDDSTVMRRMILRAIRQAGLEIDETIEATDGADGLKKASSTSPDLILSDWNMPNMSGIEFLKALRKSGSKTPFGFITTEGRTQLRQEAEQAGANFVISKPFTNEDVVRHLQPFWK